MTNKHTPPTISAIDAWKPGFDQWLSQIGTPPSSAVWDKIIQMIMMAKLEEPTHAIVDAITDTIQKYANASSGNTSAITHHQPPVTPSPPENDIVHEEYSNTNNEDASTPSEPIGHKIDIEMKHYAHTVEKYLDEVQKYPRKIVIEKRFNFVKNVYEQYLVIQTPQETISAIMDAKSLQLAPGLSERELETVLMANRALALLEHDALTIQEQEFLINPEKCLGDQVEKDLEKLRALCKNTPRIL